MDDVQTVQLSPIPPRRRTPLLPVLTLAGLGAAGGLGYYSWHLREDRAAAQARLAELEEERRALDDALELHRSSKGEVDLQLTACQQELVTEKVSRVDVDTRRISAEVDLTTCRTSVTDLREQRSDAKAVLAEFQAFTRRFQRMIDTGKLDVEFRRGQMVVKLPAAILFPSGSADLSEEGRAAIAEVAAILRKMPGRRFTVAGHTDNVPVRTERFRSNWELSTARAVTVTQMLVSRGVKPRGLVAAGYGEFAPIATNGTDAGRQRNRRIEIILEPDLRTLPIKKLQARRGSR